jgi:regulator of replication initiation timing|tara:strand:- start:159 stop:368 length:210 start_codon:yes stop_codon:yes gene_type:complete
MKNLAAQALAFQYKLQIDNATSLINVNHKPLQDLDKALGEMVTANQKLQLLNKIVAENNPKEIDTSESK